MRVAIASGIGEGRLRGPDLARPFHGTRAPTTQSESLLQRCHAYLTWMRPGNYFSHQTAARIWGLPLPRDLAETDLHVTSVRRAPSGVGIVGHHVDLPRGPVWRNGLPVSSASAVFAELAAVLSLDDLIALGDALVLDPYVLDPLDIRPWATVEEIRHRVGAFRGRGALNVRSALAMVRPGAESAPETHLRLLVVRAGLGEPELNVDIRTASGLFLGRADMAYRKYRVLLEFDGDHHRSDRRQYEKDVRRIEGFTDDGWIVVRVRAHGLYVTPAQTIVRVERALRSRGWTP